MQIIIVTVAGWPAASSLLLWRRNNLAGTSYRASGNESRLSGKDLGEWRFPPPAAEQALILHID